MTDNERFLLGAFSVVATAVAWVAYVGWRGFALVVVVNGLFMAVAALLRFGARLRDADDWVGIAINLASLAAVVAIEVSCFGLTTILVVVAWLVAIAFGRMGVRKIIASGAGS